MPAETLRPTPRSRREKACHWLADGVSFLAVLGANLVWPDTGFWSALLVAVVFPLLVLLLFGGLATPARKARLALDAERGLIECASRQPKAPPGSLQDRWKPGYAEVRHGHIRFQALYGDMEEAAGPINVFQVLSSPQPVPMPQKRPADVKRGWKIVSMDTDQGPLQLAASQASLSLLDRLWP
ncbi:hypothetical protein [Arthrobacter sp. NPDC057013]